jgi:hypothetical protein
MEVSASNENPFGFNKAIDFDEAVIIKEGELLLKFQLKT